jgi:hypothetical protein
MFPAVQKELVMNSTDAIRTQLLVSLLEHSKENPNEFVALCKQDLDSGLVRQVVADLRIEGYLEEQTRGVIRLTQLGFNAYCNKQLAWPSAASHGDHGNVGFD